MQCLVSKQHGRLVGLKVMALTRYLLLRTWYWGLRRLPLLIPAIEGSHFLILQRVRDILPWFPNSQASHSGPKPVAVLRDKLGRELDPTSAVRPGLRGMQFQLSCLDTLQYSTFGEPPDLAILAWYRYSISFSRLLFALQHKTYYIPTLMMSKLRTRQSTMAEKTRSTESSQNLVHGISDGCKQHSAQLPSRNGLGPTRLRCVGIITLLCDTWWWELNLQESATLPPNPL